MGAVMLLKGTWSKRTLGVKRLRGLGAKLAAGVVADSKDERLCMSD